MIFSLLDDVSLLADEDSTRSLLEETFLSLDEDVSFLLDEDDLLDDVSSISSESSLEIVGVEHATRNAENKSARKGFSFFTP